MSEKSKKVRSDAIEMDGQIFGRLLVMGFHSMKGKQRVFQCFCACGNTRVMRGDVIRGGAKSCGCIAREKLATPHNFKHSMVGTSTYGSWRAMISRCTNPNDPSRKWYIDRGIKVCERWLNFQHFLSDMGVKPTAKHSIDRIDSNGHYEPTNCHWATPKEQYQSRREQGHAVRTAGLKKAWETRRKGQIVTKARQRKIHKEKT